jgi:hypothetical protein
MDKFVDVFTRVNVCFVALLACLVLSELGAADPFAAPSSSGSQYAVDPFAAPSGSTSSRRYEDNDLKRFSVAQTLKDSGYIRDDFFVTLKRSAAFEKVCKKFSLDDPAKWKSVSSRLAHKNVRLREDIEEAESMMNTRDRRSSMNGKNISSASVRRNGETLYAEAMREYSEAVEVSRILKELESSFARACEQDSITGVIDIRNTAGQGFSGKVLMTDGDDVILSKDGGGYFRVPLVSLSEETLQAIASSWCSLGTKYLEGDGVAADETEAVKFYRKAAEQGNADAQYSLGLLYASGRGVATNIEVEQQNTIYAQNWYDYGKNEGMLWRSLKMAGLAPMTRDGLLVVAENGLSEGGYCSPDQQVEGKRQLNNEEFDSLMGGLYDAWDGHHDDARYVTGMKPPRIVIGETSRKNTDQQESFEVQKEKVEIEQEFRRLCPSIICNDMAEMSSTVKSMIKIGRILANDPQTHSELRSFQDLEQRILEYERLKSLSLQREPDLNATHAGIHLDFSQVGADVVITVRGTITLVKFGAMAPVTPDALLADPDLAVIGVEDDAAVLILNANQKGPRSDRPLLVYKNKQGRAGDWPFTKKLHAWMGEAITTTGDPIRLFMRNKALIVTLAPDFEFGEPFETKFVLINETLESLGLRAGRGGWGINTGDEDVDRSTWSVGVGDTIKVVNSDNDALSKL